MERKITVLGIHDGHNAGAALIRDGAVLSAISEERINNIKNYSGFPRESVRKVFQIAKVQPVEVDIVAMVGLLRTHAPLKETPFHLRLYERLTPLVHSHAFSHLLVKALHRFRHMDEFHSLLQEMGIADREVFFVEHHLAHAACAYYQRPWKDKTLVLSLDGSGDALSATVSIGQGFRMERIASSTHYDSLSNILYSEVTGFLGLKRWEHEYKVMGLAPYGKPEYCLNDMRKIIRLNPKRPLEFQNTSGAYLSQIQPWLRKRLAEQRFDNIAAACQSYFEELVVHWIKNCIKETGIRKLACSGGSFLNVKANKLIRELPEVENVFFYPASDDGGTPVGAALEAYHRLCERDGVSPSQFELRDLYYGGEFDDEQIKKAIGESGILSRAVYMKDIEGEIAESLLKGKIIARFNGRDEWGPRALGNRSILADPRDMRVIRKINNAIKFRDFWMPFAPAILEEKLDDYLIRPRFSPYMIEAFDTTEKASEIIAGIHPYDLTARPQAVNNWNLSYQRTIRDFYSVSRAGGVLNTSFNLHGYPIVGTPEVAIKTFQNSQLDGLAIGNWMIY